MNDAANETFRKLAHLRPVATCLPVMLEMLYSARDRREYERERKNLERLEWLDITRKVSEFAVELQWSLAKRGQHRMPATDVMIAATAAVHDVPLLHYDHDFDLIAEVTGQQTMWIVPRGSGH